ncbi:MAG: hypothetical protein WC465_01585 [Patescibacteria group bacterium]
MNGRIVGVNPSSIWDVILWPLLTWSWSKLTGGKVSYGWHWRPYRGQIGQVVRVAGDSSLSLHDWRHGVFWGTCFSWRTVALLCPTQRVVWHVGFRGRSGCQICSLEINGAAALLIGPEEVDFFAVSADGQPLELKQVSYSTRKLVRDNIPIL